MTATEQGGGKPGLVDRAKNILMRPGAEWARIDGEPATVQGLYTGYVIPLAAIPAVASLIGLLVFGIGAFGISYKPSIGSALTGAIVSYLLTLLGVAVLALIIEFLAPNFGGQKNRVQAFKVAAYSGTAGWVAGILNIVPALGIVAAILSLYGLYLLYKGLPILMKVAQDKALPYTAVVVIAAIVIFIVIGMITAPITAMGAGSRLAHGGGSVKVGGAEVNLGALEAASKNLEAAANRMESGEAPPTVPVAQLAALLPQSVANLPRTETSSGSGGIGGMSGSGAQAVYSAGDARIELSVADLGAMGALANLGGALNVESNTENAEGYERVGKVGGRMTTEKYQRGDRSGEYGFLVADRFMVAAEGSNVSMDQLKAAAQSVDVRRLERMAKG